MILYELIDYGTLKLIWWLFVGVLLVGFAIMDGMDLGIGTLLPFVGRTDDMFVSGGENIYPADVERMLERHPDIAQAAVVPIDDEIKGQKPVAFVVPKPGRSPSEDEIKRFALANAPAYAHPRFVWFTEELPLASTNKVDRVALHRLAQERVAGGSSRAR